MIAVHGVLLSSSEAFAQFSRQTKTPSHLSSTDRLTDDVESRYQAATVALEASQEEYRAALDALQRFKNKIDLASLPPDTEAAFERARHKLLQRGLELRLAERDRVRLELERKLSLLYGEADRLASQDTASETTEEAYEGASEAERLERMNKQLQRSASFESQVTRQINLYNQSLMLNEKRRQIDVVAAEYPEIYVAVENRAVPEQYLPSRTVLALRGLTGATRGAAALMVQKWIGRRLKSAAPRGQQAVAEALEAVAAEIPPAEAKQIQAVTANGIWKSSLAWSRRAGQRVADNRVVIGSINLGRGVARQVGRVLWWSMIYFEIEGFSEALGNMIAFSVDTEGAEASILQGVAQHYQEFKRGEGLNSYVNPFDEFRMLYGVWLRTSEAFDRADAAQIETAVDDLQKLIDSDDETKVGELLSSLRKLNDELRTKTGWNNMDPQKSSRVLQLSSQLVELEQHITEQRHSQLINTIPMIFDPRLCLSAAVATPEKR